MTCYGLLLSLSLSLSHSLSVSLSAGTGSARGHVPLQHQSFIEAEQITWLKVSPQTMPDGEIAIKGPFHHRGDSLWR